MTAKELRAARKQLGLTQAGLAHALGLSKKHGLTTIGRYERGTRTIPGPVRLAMFYLLDQATAAAYQRCFSLLGSSGKK